MSLVGIFRVLIERQFDFFEVLGQVVLSHSLESAHVVCTLMLLNTQDAPVSSRKARKMHQFTGENEQGC